MNAFRDVKRIVIKVGTSSLTYENGNLNLGAFEVLVRAISDLSNNGVQVVLVSSGAIAAGVNRLGWAKKPKAIPLKQAAAATGQPLLMHIYEKLFAEYGKTAAQILLTRADLAVRNRYVNAQNTMETLLNENVIPIVNENDTVVVDELKFGDNDTLSAQVAVLCEADLLVIFSDVEGLYTKDPRVDQTAELISEVPVLTEEHWQNARGPGSRRGTGGMYTKLLAADIATKGGIATIIAHSKHQPRLKEIIQGAPIGTFFHPHKSALKGKSRWVMFGAASSGSIVVDNGAKEALLEQGKSLLSNGILEVKGDFKRGDVVVVEDEDGSIIARGQSRFSSDELLEMIGLCSDELKTLGKNSNVAIHRNDLVVLRRDD
ncbi:MAG: glutamate 5-kinase [Bacillota bacterium]|nr:glutamate 5-kinase [Bacillota bacterium]NLU55272.1 glutamate 5-kinase [Bacillota bacterium]HOA91050.1 glutamate 5-kinase [Bacillota bacterium]HOJ47154.1 glutamate 5-kinase [Bacillota bacterium]HPQ10741.1 glutamate 5-kinase [Bacillota bacterium]